MTIDWPAFKKITAENENFVLTSHIRPDCDALGSELGLAGVLKTLGKRVRIVNGQETPPMLDFIDPARMIQVIGQDLEPSDLDDADVLVVLDTSAWAQLGPMGDVLRRSKATKVVIDHHPGEDDLGAMLFKDVGAEATGSLVAEAAEQLGIALTADMAMPLFTAVATDTGWFRFSSVDADTYHLAARLVAAGARPDDIYQQLYERDTLARFRLRGLVCSRVQSEFDGQLVHTYVLKEDFEKCGALPSDTEDVINQTLSIGNTRVAVILVEQLKGGFKISFRSRSELNCSELAAQFGGGGHKAAAGAFVQGEFAEVRRHVLDAVRQAMR